MNEQAKKELSRKSAALRALAENFGKELSRELLEMWLKLLDGYAASEVEGACLKVLTEYDYKTLPPFAVLKKALDKHAGRVDPETALRLKAEAAWIRLLEQIQTCGLYRTPENIDPTTALVLRSMGGWGVVCMWQESQLEWRRKEFLEQWRLAYGREDIMALEAGPAACQKQSLQPARQIIAKILPRNEENAALC